MMQVWTIVKRRKRAMLIAALLLLASFTLLAVLWPPSYQSQATILIEQQEIPQDLVRSTITSYADQRIQTIQQRVMTGENMLRLVDEFDLYPDERDRLAREELLELVRSNVEMEILSADVIDPRRGIPVSATIAFAISFSDEVPQNAYRVANELTSLYLDENLRSRNALAKDTTAFLRSEAQKLSDQVTTHEADLAAFKERNVNQLPEMLELNMQLVERTSRDIDQVARDLRALNDRLIYLDSELAQLNPFEAIYSETGARILSPSDRLKSLRSNLASLSGTYSQKHPDVIRMREEIAALEQEVSDQGRSRTAIAELSQKKAQLAALRGRYSDDHPTVRILDRQIDALIGSMDSAIEQTGSSDQPTNRAYLQLNAQRQSVEAEIDSLKSLQADLRGRLSQLERRVSSTPLIEKDYRELARNYQNAQLKYAEVKAKQMEADLAQALEEGRKGERFTLIDPPLLPEKPISPNRGLILLLGLVLSLFAAAAAAALRERIDDRVHGLSGIEELFGRPPLGAIPVIHNAVDRARIQSRRLLTLVGCCSAVLVLVVATHLLVMPLDTMLYAVLRRYGA